MLLAAPFDNPIAYMDLNCHTSKFNGNEKTYTHTHTHTLSFSQCGWSPLPDLAESVLIREDHVLSCCPQEVR